MKVTIVLLNSLKTSAFCGASQQNAISCIYNASTTSPSTTTSACQPSKLEPLLWLVQQQLFKQANNVIMLSNLICSLVKLQEQLVYVVGIIQSNKCITMAFWGSTTKTNFVINASMDMVWVHDPCLLWSPGHFLWLLCLIIVFYLLLVLRWPVTITSVASPNIGNLEFAQMCTHFKSYRYSSNLGITCSGGRERWWWHVWVNSSIVMHIVWSAVFDPFCPKICFHINMYISYDIINFVW